MQEQNQVLLLEHFHTHWHLRRDGAPQLLLAPLQRIEWRFRDSSVPKTTTRREPSMFEAVEAAARAPSKCSNCHALGHTMTSKACPLRHSDSRSQSAFVLELSLQATSVLESIPDPIADFDSSPVVVLPASVDLMADAVSEPYVSPLRTPLPFSHQSPRYDSPQAIYPRYVAARSAWYTAQPRGSIQTNQQYRKAIGLPLRYSKKSYEWCLDYKQMTKRCITSTGSREWTKEEMMAYLDWDTLVQQR
jgi:hypothetical protein